MALPLMTCKDGPKVVLLQAGVALIISALPCVAFYLAKAPNHPSLKFALSVALLFAASLTVCRTFLLERKYQVRACCTGLRLTSCGQDALSHCMAHQWFIMPIKVLCSLSEAAALH